MYGKEIDKFSAKHLRNGVQKERGCTDICSLILFLGTVGLIGYASIYGLQNGDLKRLTAPLDGDWRFCGSDPAVRDFPKLYITKFVLSENINDIFKNGVCVRSCPSKGYVLKEKSDFAKTAVFTNDSISVEYTTSSVMDYCIPSRKEELPKIAQQGIMQIKQMFKDTPGASYIEDISKAGRAVKYSCMSGIFYSFVFIYLMSAFAETIAWMCIILVQIGLIGVSAIMWTYRTDEIKNFFDNSPNWTVKQVEVSQQRQTGFLILTAAFAAFSLFFACCVFCGFRSLKLAIDVIDASADFLAGTKRIILVPILYFVLILVTISLWTTGFVGVYSLGTVTAEKGEIPQNRNIEFKDDRINKMIIFMVFGLLWVITWLTYSS